MKLTKLIDFFTTGTPGTVYLFGQFDTSILNQAHFKTLIPHIDRMIYYEYDTALVKGTASAPVLASDYMQFLSAWFTTRLDDLNRIYDVLAETYEPLDNYTMTEQTAEAMKRAEAQSETEAEVKPRITSQFSSTNDDHSTGRMTGYVTNGVLGTAPNANPDGKEKTTTKSKFNDTATASTTDLSATGNEVRTTEHIRRGNIGTVTAQNMANEEIDLRYRGFVTEFIKLFSNECLSGLYAVEDGWCF